MTFPARENLPQAIFLPQKMFMVSLGGMAYRGSEKVQGGLLGKGSQKGSWREWGLL